VKARASIRGRDPGGATALRIVGPGAREVEGTIQEGGPLLRGVGQEDPDLGVGGIADRAGVLAPNAAGSVALLDEPGVVDDQHPARRIAEVVDHVHP